LLLDWSSWLRLLVCTQK